MRRQLSGHVDNSRSRHATRTWSRAALAAVALVGGLGLQARPAAAADDEWICGQLVKGAILEKYRSMGGQDSPLGCPTSGEGITPDGRGRFTVFHGGSIYWTPTTGAHPVWGLIRDKWAASGWERGKLGYPLTDELTNPDNRGKRQQFEGGTYYWHPTVSNGVHAVVGRIGQLWSEYGWEDGSFGYPAGDETQVLNSVEIRQQFSKGYTLSWNPGDGKVCASECTSYTNMVRSTPWVEYTKVYKFENSDKKLVEIRPTAAGYKEPRANSDDPNVAAANFKKLWDEVWSLAPYPKGLEAQDKANSIGKQMWCHALWSFDIPIKGRLGGDTWDLESWRPDIPWSRITSATEVWKHKCNWDS
ncbi:hypothetical protein ACFVTF_05615 [Kitasatospora sp. NPDC057940]|uniref:hypothetical protein n=1 Tax=Kitasatospora sp. NPDC057940 TaxID=3346285 RepID=UPI0036D86186